MKELRTPARVKFLREPFRSAWIACRPCVRAFASAGSRPVGTVGAGAAPGLSRCTPVVSVWIYRTGIQVAHANPVWFIRSWAMCCCPGLRVCASTPYRCVVVLLQHRPRVLAGAADHRDVPAVFSWSLSERSTPTLLTGCTAGCELRFVRDATGWCRRVCVSVLYCRVLYDLLAHANALLRTRFFLFGWVAFASARAVTIASLMMTHRVAVSRSLCSPPSCWRCRPWWCLRRIWAHRQAAARHEICV